MRSNWEAKSVENKEFSVNPSQDRNHFKTK